MDTVFTLAQTETRDSSLHIHKIPLQQIAKHFNSTINFPRFVRPSE